MNLFSDCVAMPLRLDAAIDRAIAEQRIVGTVVLVAHDGDVIYRRAAGLADREAGVAMHEEAIFRLASITKPYVSATVMKLVEDGRFALDDAVTRFLPDFRPRLADGSEPVITLGQLITHTSGLSYRFLEPPQSAYHALDISDGLDQPGLSLPDNLRRLVAAPLKFAPGKRWNYSLGIDVLGGVIEQVMQRPLGDVVRELVTAPLGMTDTAFHVVDRARLVTPYADGKPEPQRMTDGIAVPLFDGHGLFAPSRILDPASYPSGGGGMAGTARDTLRFLEAIRNGGAPILTPVTVADMKTAHFGAKAQTQGPGWGFGRGWAVLIDAALSGTPQANGTIQWSGAYGHSWFVDPANRLTVIALTNTAFEGMTVSGAYPNEIRDAVYG